jgi:prepilin-type N-terminal cleavage/methylation domain-containing protein
MKICAGKQTLARAFTLLELMVALALLAFIVIAIYSTWYSILKGSKVALDAAAAAQRSRITMRTLQDSLSCACIYNQNIRYYTFLADSDGGFASLSFVARLPKSFPHGGKFGDLDMRRLTFSVEEGPDSQKQLVLRQNPILMEVDQDEQNYPLVLARNIKKFIVRYPDPKTGEWVQEWTATNQLPSKVEILVQLGALDQFSTKPQEALFGEAILAAQPVRVEWQMPLGAGGAGQQRTNNFNGGQNNFTGQPGGNPRQGVGNFR